MADSHRALQLLHQSVTACDRCPRLVAYRSALPPRAAYADLAYWRRPVPGFGDAALWVIGLAPGAHGANRTGRVFTGDRSGDFLYAPLHRAGLANQQTSTDHGDGLTLRGAYVSGTARCAPPDNRPTPAEVAACAPFLNRQWDLLAAKRTILALGAIGWAAALDLAARHGCVAGRPRPRFAHAAEVPLPPTLSL